jgi:hypothetical protein
LATTAAPIIAITSAVVGQWTVAWIAATGFVTFEICNAWLLRLIFRANVQALNRRATRITTVEHTDTCVPQMNKSTQYEPKYFLPAMLAIQLLYPIAAIGAWRARKVVWRGIEYLLGSKSTIQLVRYRPFSELDRNGSDSIN